MGFLKRMGRSLLILVLMLALPSVAFSLSPPLPSEPEAGLSAAWYDPENSGSGWVLEILDEERASVYWYTYDADGKPRWAVGAGRVDKDGQGIPFINVADLFAGSGARFGAMFDEGDVELERVGNAQFSFQVCQSSLGLSGEAFGEDISQRLDRLTRTMGAGCSPLNGIPGEPVRAYAGQSGAWYNPDREGEGFTLQWLARDEALVYWFTYDTEGNPYWLFGLGIEEEGSINILELYAAERDQDGVVSLTTWGTLTLTLSCNAGTLEYDSVVPDFGAGSIPVQRLNDLAAPKCPYVAPTFTDLYDIDLVVLPLAAGEVIDVTSVGDDGTVSGLRQLQNGSAEAVLLPLGASAWATIDGQALDSGLPLFISNDARMLLGNATEIATPDAPVQWTSVGGWSPAPGFDGNSEQGIFNLFGVSSDFMAFAGRLAPGSEGEKSEPWFFHPATGTRVLPIVEDDDFGNAVAMDISNDGRTVIGGQDWSGPIIPTISYSAGNYALLWKDGGQPEFLENGEDGFLADATVCNADCSIVYGSDSNFSKFQTDRPIQGQAWAWNEDRGVARIERPRTWEGKDKPISTTDDGYLMVGSSIVNNALITPPVPATAFLWTQTTGTVNINTLLIETGFDADPNSRYSSAVSVSAGGKFIALQPDRYNESGRAALMILTPREE